MYDINGSLENQILELMHNRPTVIFTDPLDPRVIEAACYLPRFARMVFLASETEVHAVMAEELGHLDPVRVAFACSECAFVDIDKNEKLVDEFAQAYINLPEGIGWTRDIEEAREIVKKPPIFGIMAVRQGHADAVVGGVTHPPKEYCRPMLKLLRMGEVMLEAGVFVLPDDFPHDIFPYNIIVFGDVGVNATMTPEKLARIAVGTCAVARDLIPEDILPTINGAIVSYSNRGSDEGPSPELVRKATELVPEVLADRIERGERYKTIHIEGEVKVSVALSKRSAEYYLKEQGRDFGSTNVIIAPNLELGNFLYHLYAARFPEAKKFPVVYGVRFRGIDMALDCTAEDVELAVKANIVRLHRFGHWDRTPKDTFFRRYRILAVNPGSTSTKISLFDGDIENFADEIHHSSEELKPFANKSIIEQFNLRKDAVLKTLSAHNHSLDDIDAVSARGGLLRPIPHGTYAINESMRQDLLDSFGGEHASNLGALIAYELTRDCDKPAFIVDPVVVDEVPIRSKITGIKAIRRNIVSHALNQIATARRYAEENETFYEYLNVIVCHMGGGISIGAHKKGRFIDVNNALDGEGPFTPERSGSLPTRRVIDLCFSGEYSYEELKELNRGRGGLIDLLGASDFRKVENRVADGDNEAIEVVDAFAYQIAKNITALLPAFDGESVDRILLTGGLARSELLVHKIQKSVSAMECGVTVYPGENEMLALAKGALRVLRGVEMVKEYNPQ